VWRLVTFHTLFPWGDKAAGVWS